MKVLIVDDDPVIATGLEGVLAVNGISSARAAGVAEAEALLTAEFFPVVLADLRLRTDDEGLRLLESVRRLSPSSNVASMTGFADAATEQKLREYGAQLVLHKPFEEADLLEAIRWMVGEIDRASATTDNLDAVYESTVDTLYRIARGRFRFATEDAEELIQETWLLFLEKRASVRNPTTWLSGTIANLCRREIERRVKERASSTDEHEAEYLPNTDAVLMVRHAMRQLDARSRILCTWIGLERRSYEEVSTMANMPLGSVGTLYQRARKRLRSIVSGP